MRSVVLREASSCGKSRPAGRAVLRDKWLRRDAAGDTGAAGCFFAEKRVPPRFSVGAMLYPCFPAGLCCVGAFRREDYAVFGLFD